MIDFDTEEYYGGLYPDPPEEVENEEPFIDYATFLEMLAEEESLQSKLDNFLENEEG